MRFIAVLFVLLAACSEPSRLFKEDAAPAEPASVAVQPGTVVISNGSTGEILVVDRDTPEPSCTPESCERALNETCRVYVPPPVTAFGPHYLGQCDSATVVPNGQTRQCSCRCMSLSGEVNVTTSCHDRWLVEREGVQEGPDGFPVTGLQPPTRTESFPATGGAR